MQPQIPLLLASMVTDGASLTNTVTATTLLHGSAKPNIGGGVFQAGSTLIAELRGSMGVGASGAGNFTFDMRIGGTVISNFGAMSLRTSSCSTLSWYARLEATIQTPSTAGSLISGMEFYGAQALGGTNATTTPVVITLPVTQPNSNGNAIDNTVNGLFDIFGTWSVATSGNIMLVRQAKIWLVG